MQVPSCAEVVDMLQTRPSHSGGSASAFRSSVQHTSAFVLIGWERHLHVRQLCALGSVARAQCTS